MAQPLEFEARPDCRRCILWEQASHPGMASVGPIFGEPSHDRALIVIGQAPGYIEDRQNKLWTGPAGAFLREALQKVELNTIADIYLTNACRCLPPQGHTPSQGQVRACSSYLQAEIHALAQRYPDRLALLCTGAPAARSILNCSLTGALARQGVLARPHVANKWADDIRIETGLGANEGLNPLPVYSTYNPAYILKQKPELVYAFRDHLLHMRSCLSDDTRFVRAIPDAPVYTEAQDPPREMPPLVSLDIETYGALAEYDQTVFHPRKSMSIDEIPKHQLVQTVAISWRGPSGEELVTVFNYRNPRHRIVFYRWLSRLAKAHSTILGQNLPFDIQYLRFADPIAAQFLRRDRLNLSDLILWNFLHSESRPERSLKSLAKLFSLAHYAELPFNSSGPNDPRLLEYNALDAVVTYRGYDLLRTAILETYGTSSAKLAPACAQHCSDLLWSVIHMSEAGVPFNIPNATAFLDRTTVECNAIVAEAKDTHDIKICGTGSGKDVQALIDSAADACDMLSPLDPRVLMTDKTKLVSSKEENINLFLSELPDDSPVLPRLRLLLRYRGVSKLLSTYLKPLLSHSVKGTIEVLRDTVGITYPTWYVCPSKYDKDTSKEGGTCQGRITCKKFAWQTSPLDVKHLICSRFSRGNIIAADFSQIELRTAALLSGDPVMMSEYAEGVDRHARTGSLIYDIIHPDDSGGFERLPLDSPKRNDYRQMGKTANFLILFGGGAQTLCDTIRRDLGLIISLEAAELIIDANTTRYSTLVAWQDGLLDTANRKGYIELPTGWSRTFPSRRRLIYGKDKPTILDFPVQTIAAQLVQSAQAEVTEELETRGFQSRIILTIYDALYIDTLDRERPLVLDILARRLPHPPLLAQLSDLLGRTVPLTYGLEDMTT